MMFPFVLTLAVALVLRALLFCGSLCYFGRFAYVRTFPPPRHPLTLNRIVGNGRLFALSFSLRLFAFSPSVLLNRTKTELKTFRLRFSFPPCQANPPFCFSSKSFWGTVGGGFFGRRGPVEFAGRLDFLPKGFVYACRLPWVWWLTQPKAE